MNALQQFESATVDVVDVEEATDGITIRFILVNGRERDLCIYIRQGDLAVRINGMYVPPEEL